jgi:hypothetical protein
LNVGKPKLLTPETLLLLESSAAHSLIGLFLPSTALKPNKRTKALKLLLRVCLRSISDENRDGGRAFSRFSAVKANSVSRFRPA